MGKKKEKFVWKRKKRWKMKTVYDEKELRDETVDYNGQPIRVIVRQLIGECVEQRTGERSVRRVWHEINEHPVHGIIRNIRYGYTQVPNKYKGLF